MSIRTTAVLLAVAYASVIGIGCGRSDDARPKSQTFDLATSTAEPNLTRRPLAELATQTPDGAEIITLYHDAETVNAIEAANQTVRTDILKAVSIISDLAALHAALMTSCEQVDGDPVTAIVAKAKALAVNVARIDGEVTKSLAAMRQSVEAEKPPSQRSKEQVDRYIIAAHVLGQLRVQAQEISKTVGGLAASIRRAANTCRPKPIPRLFTRGVARAANIQPEPTETSGTPLPPKRPAATKATKNCQPLRWSNGPVVYDRDAWRAACR